MRWLHAEHRQRIGARHVRFSEAAKADGLLRSMSVPVLLFMYYILAQALGGREC